MAFRIRDITGALKLGGARPNAFRVNIASPPGGSSDIPELAPFFCQATSLPRSSIQPINVPYFGRTIKVAGDRTFESWDVQILNDEDFKLRQAFETWHHRINSLAGNINLAGTPAPTQYKASADVQQFSKSGNGPIRTYKFVGLFPIDIGEIQLAWDANDRIEMFNVRFTYDYFEVVGGTTGTVQG